MVTPVRWWPAIVVLLMVVALGGCGSSATGSEPVADDELRELLAGNTIVGEWLGEPYRQFFDVDGTTTYVPDGARESTGRWRVDEASGGYESWWNDRDGWERYDVTGDGSTFYWTGGGVDQSPFTVLDGNQLR